ncbi:MAG: hypothetical protein PHG22_03680 [Patescibacteria group bacterium]|nr:hypothetical protein [Patescibacteria group bacterium]
MKNLLVFVVLFAATMLFATVVTAAGNNQPVAKLGYNTQVLMPFATTDGHWEGGGLGLANSFALTIPFPDGWAVGVEPGVQTGLAAFLPNPQLAASASYQFTNKFSLGAGGLYRYLPKYTGGAPTDGQLFAAAVTPIFPLGPVVLAFPVGPAYNTIAKKWGGVFSVKLTFPLAAW